MQSNLFLVVIAGGSGTRFWPKSTSKRPKQLLQFGATEETKETLLGQTLARFKKLVPEENQFIVTTRSLESAVTAENLKATVLAEPQGRNTAPCIYWAAQVVAQKNPKGIMLVMPADHYIAAPEKLVATIKQAAEWASHEDDLITLAIKPSRPETGYGYLKISNEGLKSGHPPGLKKVEAFVEKPNPEKAAEFLRLGNYFWNGGMFVWRAEVILKAFDQFMPEMRKAWQETHGEIEAAYPKMTATSIDYGIMEKAGNVVTFPLDCGWDDLGSWLSLESLADSLGIRVNSNVVNEGEVLSVDSSGNIVDAKDSYIALLGVQDLIVAQQGKTLLIANKDRAQDLRKIVEETKKRRPELI